MTKEAESLKGLLRMKQTFTTNFSYKEESDAFDGLASLIDSDFSSLSSHITSSEIVFCLEFGLMTLFQVQRD